MDRLRNRFLKSPVYAPAKPAPATESQAMPRKRMKAEGTPGGGQLSAEGYNKRGLAFYNKGELDKAIAEYNEAIRLDPQTAEFYNNRVRTADISVFAWDVKGRYLSSKWKTFYDRAFFWNHTPSLAEKQMGYIISGPISQVPNLAQILEASCTARQDANFVDIISDECEDSAQIDAQLQSFAERLVSYSVKNYVRPGNFLAVG